MRDKTKRILLINWLASDCHDTARRKGFHKKIANICNSSPIGMLAVRMMLTVTEVCEGFVKIRDTDDMAVIGSELADVIIRVFDLAQTLNLPIGELLVEKIETNEHRPTLHGHKNF